MADTKEILKLIEEAAKEGRTELDLSKSELTGVPSEIAKLTHLTSLDLSENELTSLPPEITKLTSLTSLDLSQNQLTSLPPEITKLTNLTKLELGLNQLTNLPPEIIELTNLRALILSQNQLTTLPLEITKLTKPALNTSSVWLMKHGKKKAFRKSSSTSIRKQVLDFRDRFPKEGLLWPYKGKAEFEKLVRNHLVNYIRTLT